MAGIATSTSLKAGRISLNHNRRPASLEVSTGLKSGRLAQNHNRRPI
jgi:hypothetical protein